MGSGAHKEAARVSSGLGQGAGAVGQLCQEVGQLVLQCLPGQTLCTGPSHRVLSEVVTQVPGQSVIIGPERQHIPIMVMLHELRARPCLACGFQASMMIYIQLDAPSPFSVLRPYFFPR